MPSDDTMDKNLSKPREPERNMKPLLFDPVWYLEQNADVAKARLDPVQHYLKYGAREGRNPNSFFNTKAYLTANADVRASPLNPFLHFVLYGFREGRDPSPVPKTTPVKKLERAVPKAIIRPAPIEPPQEKVSQTLLNAASTTAAETNGNDKRGSEVPVGPTESSTKPSSRLRIKGKP